MLSRLTTHHLRQEVVRDLHRAARIALHVRQLPLQRPAQQAVQQPQQWCPVVHVLVSPHTVLQSRCVECCMRRSIHCALRVPGDTLNSRNAHAVEEAGQHVAGVAEDDGHINVRRLLGQLLQVARPAQVDADLRAQEAGIVCSSICKCAAMMGTTDQKQPQRQRIQPCLIRCSCCRSCQPPA